MLSFHKSPQDILSLYVKKTKTNWHYQKDDFHILYFLIGFGMLFENLVKRL